MLLSPTERPFELLKLIRDGVIKNTSELKKVALKSNYPLDPFVENLEKIGFITISHRGDLTPTPRLSRIFQGLGVSLTQLSPFTSNSIVVSPEFGVPHNPLLKADVIVVMPFSDNLRPVYEDHIKALIRELDLTVSRADDFFSATSIISDIWNSIYASKIVIADCTGRNPNVFYEIGIAHTLGKPVILLAQSEDDIPFDIQHIRALIYAYTPGGMKDLMGKLKISIQHEISRSKSLLDLLKDSL